MSRPHRRSSSDPGGQQHVHDTHAGTGNAPTTSMTPSPSFSPPPHVIPQTRASSRSEGYPSWLPRRPPPPAPQSTIHSSRVPTYAGEDEAPIKRSSFFGVGRKPTPRSMRVVSLQDSPTPLNRSGSYGNRLASPGGRRVWSRATGSPFASTLVGGGRASSFFGSTAAAAAAAIRPRFKSTALRLELLRSPFWFTRLRFYLFPLFVFAHIPLQTFFDFNAVFILFKVAQLPNSAAPGVQGSGSGWTLAAVVYIACWAIWLFFVVFLYEFIYSFVRRWRIKRPLITPLYLSSAGFNYVSMTSYTHFCFFQHIRLSAFAPSSGGSLHDGLAETCWFYAQNWPTVALLLPRAGLCVALLLALSGPQPGLVALADQGITRDSAVYFRADDGGALTGYARGVLYANAAWAAWRALVVLASWTGLWILSGHGCAGLCGPRYRWEEEAATAALGGGEKMSMYSEAGILPDTAPRPPSTMVGAASSTAAAGTTIVNPAAVVTAASTIDEEQQLDALPWSWRQHTRERIFDAWEFCLTVKPLRWASNGAAFANGRKEPGAAASVPAPDAAPAANNNADVNEKAMQQQQQKPAFEGVEQVIAAVGLPGHPLPAKRGVLSEQLFESPVEGSYLEKRQQQQEPQAGPSRHHISEGEEDSEPVSSEGAAVRVAGTGTTSGSAAESSSQEGVNTPIRKGIHNKKQKPSKLGPAVSSPYPYPFTARGSQFSSEDKIPFPPSPSRSRVEAQEEDEEAPEGEEEEEEEEEVYDEEEEDEVASRDPSSGRTSASLSSLGQPIVSRYPFQFRQPTRGGSLSSSGIQSHATPRSGIISGASANSGSGSGASPPSSTTNSRSHYSYYSHFSQSTGNRESSDSHSPSSQGGGGNGSGSGGGADSSAASAAALGLAYSPIPHPPRHPSHQQHVGRVRAGTNPVVSPTPAQRRRRRPRGSAGSAIAAPTMMAAPTATTSSSTTRRLVGAAAAAATVDPDVSYEPSVHEEYLDHSGSGTGDDSMIEQPVAEEEEEEEAGPQEEAEQDDNVGLLSSDSRGPSPRASFVSLHRLRTRSSSSRHHRISATSNSNGAASSSSSSARSRTGSSVSQSVRSRAQSMVHSIGAASRSSLDLAYAAVVATRTRTRTHSSLARLQDEEAAAAAWGSGHSRSGSGSNSDAILSSPENYTFGHPMREQWRRDEEAAAAAANGGNLLPGGVERIEEESGSLRSNTSDGSRGMVTEAHFTAPSEPYSVPPSTFGGRSADSERSPSEFMASNESQQQQPMMEGDGLDREHRRRRQSSSATGGALTIRGLMTTATEPYADGETESSASRPDISTAAGSFVTAPATPDDATESSEGGRTMASSNWNVFRAMPPHHHGHGHGWQHGPA